MHLQFFEILCLTPVSTKILKKPCGASLIFFFISVKNIVLNLFWNCVFHFLGGDSHIFLKFYLLISFFFPKNSKNVCFLRPFLTDQNH